MKNKTLGILTIWSSMIALLASVAMAAQGEGILGNILGPLAGKDFVGTYLKYATFIDMVIYLIVFLGLAQWTLGKKMEGKSGKTVTTGIAIVMAVSLALFESVLGFNIVVLGPIAMTIAIGVLGLAIYEGLKSSGMDKKIAMSIAYAGVFLTFTSVVTMATAVNLSSGYSTISFGYLKSDTFRLVIGIGALLMLPAMWFIGKSIYKFTFGKVGINTGGGLSDLPSTPTETQTPSNVPADEAPPADEGKEKKAKKDLKREEQAELNEAIEIKKMAEEIKALIEDLVKRPATTIEEIKRKREGAKSVIRNITNKELKQLNRMNKRVEKFAVRLLNDLKTAGSKLKAEDEAEINLALKNAEGIKNLQMFGGDLIKELKKEDTKIDTKVFEELKKFYEILNEMYKNTENLLLIDKRLRKQLGA